MPTESNLELLHDHYKETFAIIRSAEGRRDRLFIFVILVFALLILQILYPASFRSTAGKVTVGGIEINGAAIPLAPLLDATWVLTLVMCLRYCQTSISVQRKYAYLHKLELVIADKLGPASMFSREGEAYLSMYPLVLSWAWFCYVVLFPVIVTVATVGLLVVAWTRLNYGLFHRSFATVCGLSVLVSFFLYQVLPNLGRIRKIILDARMRISRP